MFKISFSKKELNLRHVAINFLLAGGARYEAGSGVPVPAAALLAQDDITAYQKVIF